MPSTVTGVPLHIMQVLSRAESKSIHIEQSLSNIQGTNDNILPPQSTTVKIKPTSCRREHNNYFKEKIQEKAAKKNKQLSN